MKIGILSIQGDFAAHAAMLQTLGAETLEVRTVADLRKSDALSFPAARAPRNSNSCRKKVSSTPFANSPPKATPSSAPAPAPFSSRPTSKILRNAHSLSGHDRSSQWLWPPTCQRCFLWTHHAEKRSARNGFYSRPHHRKPRSRHRGPRQTQGSPTLVQKNISLPRRSTPNSPATPPSTNTSFP